jgi:ureidoacrylate peracid hydrolase
LVRDTWNTDVIPELRPEAVVVVLYKHRFSGFYQTELDDILRRLGIRNLIFTGCTTSVCVDSTIRDAMFRNYRCELLLIESVAYTQGIDDRVGIEPNP